MYNYKEDLMPRGGVWEKLHWATETIKHWLGLMNQTVPPTTVTYTVHEKSTGRCLASVSNRRINGRYVKQAWGGRRDNDAYKVGEESFDATDYVLRMKLDKLHCLQDGHESSDTVGEAHIDWDGPHEVYIVDAVLAYFGVAELREITQEQLDFVLDHVQPQESELQTVTLTFKVDVRKPKGADTAEFVNDLEYNLRSNTPGIVVIDTELVSSE